MREGPSEPLYKGRLQTALQLLGSRALVVSVQGKDDGIIWNGQSRDISLLESS